jgi:hypothetical protein
VGALADVVASDTHGRRTTSPGDNMLSLADAPPEPSLPSAARVYEEPRDPVQLATSMLLRNASQARLTGLPMGAVVTPCLLPLETTHAAAATGGSSGDARVSLPCIRRAAARCGRCGGYLNHYCETAKGAAGAGVTWKCVFCGTQNTSRQVEHTMSPELQAATVEYRAPHEQPLHAGAGVTMTPPPPPPPHTLLLVVDTAAEAPELEAVTGALTAAIEASCNPSWEVSWSWAAGHGTARRCARAWGAPGGQVLGAALSCVVFCF